ncbi:Protein phosphatase PP2A regulatory subunit B [Pichia californica]|uniref:aminodeoxychorismate synthase n=1 Tax=Pichia californica TaxID=460514 RepID=A0A9P7BI04_9ASCO|nr:Protein phosphatase PP2A regulatory subunit B [[Candida] californica]KAG0691280.1 Protein phosphatase PP2A regulatory subunit B [[Candida] californica]
MSILLVDSYDSFTYNLRDLLLKSTDSHVITIHNDSYNLENTSDKTELDNLLESVDAIVIGPGPGSPSNPSDIGIIPYIYSECSTKPILGICLGFQILCLLNGCSIDYLKEPIHGQVHPIDIVCKSSIFKGFPDSVDSVRYHSIFVDHVKNSKLIKPLAYYNDTEKNTQTLMAAQHVEKPHFGVQYHPESICSTFGKKLVQNFWSLVNVKKIHEFKPPVSNDKHLVSSVPLIKEFNPNNNFNFNYKILSLENKCILNLCDLIKSNGDDIMLLNSASSPGEWSIIGLPITAESDVITHSTENPSIINISKWNSNQESTDINTTDIFQFLSDYMSEKYYLPEVDNNELKSCPFIGGLIGYFSYEEGNFIDTKKLLKRTKSNIDDTKLCFIERYIAISPQNNVFLVSIKKDDEEFLFNTKAKLTSKYAKNINNLESDKLKENTNIILPNKDQYFETFHKCQEYLHSGDSYELCLTYNTIVQIPNSFKPWDVYKLLVKKNPSPYSSYINFNSSILLSTSPERFLSWNEKSCQMRPIKGTLKKSLDINYEKACKLLKIPKEIGENLMIVDLIRDNLLFLLDDIEVTKLMTVEEYETIYQLVSVIDGKFTNQFKGIDVLKNSLPPGSMTGAPKKRSVEILQQLENQQRRGLYSGICGYWSINDNADWSVIIRSLFSYSDDLNYKEGFHTYRCGAGGALTVLSSDNGEWDEMLVKLHSVLQLFE